MSSRLTTRGGRRVALNLPPDSGLEEIETARAEMERLSKERRGDEGRLSELGTARKTAKQSDLELAARAIRVGTKAPKVRAVDAVDEEISRLEEHIAVLNEAIDQVENELIEAVELLREQRMAEFDEQFAKEVADWRGEILERVDQLERINQIGSLRAWYRDFPGKFPSFRQRTYGHLEMRDGTNSPATALQALHGAFDPREASDLRAMPVPDGPRPLRSPSAA